MMLRVLAAVALGAASAGTLRGAPRDGLVAHWTFDEGTGTVLHDRSGNGHDGNLHRVAWVTTPSGPGLKFERSDSFVDCGDTPALKIRGDLSIVAWVKVAAPTFPDNTTNWCVVNWEDYPRSGFLLRIEGWRSTLLFRCSNGLQEKYVQSENTLDNNVFYHVAVVKQGSTATLYVDGMVEASGEVQDPGPSSAPFLIGGTDQSFDGVMDELQVYSRPILPAEVISDFRAGAARHAKDTSFFGELRLTPYLYAADQALFVELDSRGVLPLAAGESIVLELGPRGAPALQTRTLDAGTDRGRSSAEFALAGLAPGEYEVRALLQHADGRAPARTAASFHYPPLPVVVPSPREQEVGPLPQPAACLAYDLKLCKGGGLALSLQGKTYPLESSFSFPQAGDNRLVAAPAAFAGGEPTWTVDSGPGRYELTAQGQYYRIRRQVTTYPNRIAVKDTLTNLTAAPLGIIVAHELRLTGSPLETSYVMGLGGTASVPERSIMYNPTLLLRTQGFGVGLVALDDVFVVQSLGAVDQASQQARLATRTFALDSHAAYTLEWAVYPVATGDYYDFINEIRRDEGRNAVTADSNWTCMANSRQIPDAEFMRLRNARYIEHGSPYAPPEDPELSYQSFDLLQFPREVARLKEYNADLLKAIPEAKPNIHVGPWLYLTRTPEEAFPDARIIGRDGKQGFWPLTSYVYLSQARQEAGWRWYGFYPTLTNSYGKALLASVDPFLDQMGFKCLFMDGFFWGMAGWTTESEWDRHSAEIDPSSKTITRRFGSVLLLSQEALVAYVQKVTGKGATLIANNVIVTRTMGRQPMIIDKEITEGPTVHLAQTPITLGNPDVIKSEEGIYADVRNKLKWGNLYFWYGGDNFLRHPTVPTRMYPFTVEEIHSDYVKGKERLVTAIPGAYGWAGSHDLHYAWVYDGRGREQPNTLLSTAAKTGVRTQVALGPRGMAVLERIPVSLEAARPVNLIVERYDQDGIRLALHGSARAEITVKNGRFAVSPQTAYSVKLPAGATRLSSDAEGVLTISLKLVGPARVEIER